jgi:hypothetical protein
MTVHEGDHGGNESEDYSTNRKSTTLEEEVTVLRQANEDLRKTLQINKRLIGEIASNGNIQEVIQ